MFVLADVKFMGNVVKKRHASGIYRYMLLFKVNSGAWEFQSLVPKLEAVKQGFMNKMLFIQEC